MVKLNRKPVLGSGYGPLADAEQPEQPEPAAQKPEPERAAREPAVAEVREDARQEPPAVIVPVPVDVPPEVPEAPPVPVAAVKVATQPARRRGTSVGWARREVDRSTLSARQRIRGAWAATPVRFSVAVHEVLTGRLVDDQERTGDYRLSFNHYVSAALRQVPADARQAADWAQLYQDYLGVRSVATVGTKMSVEVSVAEMMPRLQAQLRRSYRHGLIGHVQTWAIIGLLADLDAADAGEVDDSAARLRVLERLDVAMR